MRAREDVSVCRWKRQTEFQSNAKGTTLDAMKYCELRIRSVRAWYLFASVLWIALLSALQVTRYLRDTLFAWIAMFPLIVFTIAFASAENLETETEQTLMKYNTLTLGLVIVLPLLTWISDRFSGKGIQRKQYVGILITALVFGMLALVDVWVPQRWMSLETHIRSTLQTMALGLLIIALYLFYLYHPPA